MAFHTRNVTLTGGRDAIVSTHTPVKQVLIFNVTGNGTVFVGDRNMEASATPTTYGFSVAAGAVSPPLGPFSGEQAFNLDEVFLAGTNTNVARVTYIT